MPKRKSFTAYVPEGGNEIDINGTVFRLNPMVPGDVLLDFISGAREDDPAAMARTVRGLLDAAIDPIDLDAWHEFIRNPDNAVDLVLLSEIAGYVSEVLSGNPQKASSNSGTG